MPSTTIPPIPHTFDDVLRRVADERRPPRTTLHARPFLKWVGGKRSVLPALIERMPPSFRGYYEPFVGGGALFFAVQPKGAHLSDINLHLVLAYRAVRDDVDRLVPLLEAHRRRHGKDHFLAARRRIAREKDPTKVAALMIYLNKTCFNGLYRVNRAGEFNVPIGSYAEPHIADEETLRADSALLRDTDIEQKHFSQVPIRREAFYYLDPPYHGTYSQYDGSGFGDAEHEELAAFCGKIDSAGGRFMVSNSDTALVRFLYRRYRVEEISASRSVSCKAHQRGKENELLIRNYR